MSLPVLYKIHYSPWSEKAKWALQARGIAHKQVEYLPMIETLWLRARTGRWTGKLTVPVLIADGQQVGDSFLIAQWAAVRGQGPELIADGRLAEVAAWNDRCETVMANGRALVTPRVAGQPDSALEQIPPALRWIGPLSAPLVKLGVRYLQEKYALDAVGQDGRREAIRTELIGLRQALQGGDHLLGSFSFADIAMAVALQVVQPVADQFIKLGPATRRQWRDPILADEFADVLAWRDRIYAGFRHN